MVSSACVELPRGPFGLVFSLRNIKNITRQVGVSLAKHDGDLGPNIHDDSSSATRGKNDRGGSAENVFCSEPWVGGAI